MRLDSIKVKITFFAGVTLLVVMCALIAYSGINLWNVSMEDDIAEAEALADGYASRAAAELEVSIDTARSIAVAIAGIIESGAIADRIVVDSMLLGVLKDNPGFIGISVGMEPNALDDMDELYINTEGHDATGRYIPYFSRAADGRIIKSFLEGYDTDDYYQLPKRTRTECIINPYFYKVNGKDVFMTSLMAPIMVKGEFIGVVGIDVALDVFQKQMTDAVVFGGSGKLCMIANNGDIAAFGGAPDLIGVNLRQAFKDMPTLAEQVGRGESFTIFSEALQEYGIFRPIQVGRNTTPWSIIVVLPKQLIVDKASGAVLNQTLIALLMLVLGISCMWFVASRIAKPLVLMARVANIVADSQFQDLSQIPEDKVFSGELLDVHRALGSMVQQALQAMGDAKANADEAEEKARQAEQAVLEAEEAKRESELATQRGINEAAGRIRGIVERVSSATEQLSAQVDQSNQGAETQKDRMTETATAMEEMNATVLEVAKNASEAASNADDAKSRAAQGADVVGRVVSSITEINERAGDMKGSLDELGNQAEGIGQIMNVISDIADQTNLLALNAAIEAARAGDAGRGFAVVADEVRKLAEKTMAATREVGEAITSIQSGTRNNISNMDEVARVIEQSTELATESGDSLGNIVTIAESTADQVRAIATASEEQAATSEEINRGTEEVTRISAETSDTMDQAANALVELSAMTTELAAIVEEMQQ